MATVPLPHARCGYSMRIANRKSASQQNAVGSSSSPCWSSSLAPNSGLSFSSGKNSGHRHQGLGAQAMTTTSQGKSIEKGIGILNHDPDHLLVLVHGILASPGDWTYAEGELKRHLGKNFLIYGHASCKEDRKPKKDVSREGTIVGLEPINFITLATPHLGVKGRKQLPFLLGVPILEKLAPPIAPFFVGQRGSQLFLNDGKPNKPPFLLRMAFDCEDGKFISALGAFRCRTVYANVSYDPMVGWRTSSIRREIELSKPPLRSLDGYKHIVDVEYCPPVPSDGLQFPPEAAKAKEAAQNALTLNTIEYYEIMEEEMICGLQQLGWRKVNVSFHSAAWPFFAHNNIHVKNEWLHNAGVEVIAHVADSLRQQETSSVLATSL